MMKRGMPQWNSVSRVTIRSDSFKVYEVEKKKLKALLKKVDQIGLTTDLWKSKPQKIEYMVLTAYFVDLDWKLQKRVLNFVHLSPPRKGVNIADCILTCLKEWEIEDKVFTIKVDNVSESDYCIKILKDNFATNGRLLCCGKIFHFRFCVHILNIMVQHGLQQVQCIIEKVHDTVDFLNASYVRLKRFGELISQYNLQDRKLILECKTSWNSTYDMLDCVIKFRKVFPRYALHDHSYKHCLDDDEWEKLKNYLKF
ncbi:zinc finger BED domain-containing protein RICESLEEPER 2-like [Hibiscus syriacus]|uniref:zinc finger BED domain-containing protein RICESLEEPER 2-like n=1 Tax=Hibiscus syriacus TaxID=106335 RepID=UPI0019240B0E|nr:zinc finger BED domain-containing protein RICESLEEPER 2-like [Hibiscus syriacus]